MNFNNAFLILLINTGFFCSILVVNAQLSKIPALWNTARSQACGAENELASVLSMAVFDDYIYQIKWGKEILVYRMANKRYNETTDKFQLKYPRRFDLNSLVPEFWKHENFGARFDFILKNIPSQKVRRIGIVLTAKTYDKGSAWYWMLKFSTRFFANTLYWDEGSDSDNQVQQNDVYTILQQPQDMIMISGGKECYYLVFHYNYDPYNVFSDKTKPLVSHLTLHQNNPRESNRLGYLCQVSDSGRTTIWMLSISKCIIPQRFSDEIKRINYGFSIKKKLYLISNDDDKVFIMSNQLLTLPPDSHKVKVTVKTIYSVFVCENEIDIPNDFPPPDFDPNQPTLLPIMAFRNIYIFIILINMIILIICGLFIRRYVKQNGIETWFELCCCYNESKEKKTEAISVQSAVSAESSMPIYKQPDSYSSSTVSAPPSTTFVSVHKDQPPKYIKYIKYTKVR